MATALRSLSIADSARAEFEDYLSRAQRKSLLRFITCGSVDDGKSTLIGRLLYDSKSLLEDQLATLTADSRKVGTQGDALDFALLVDGLGAEREQGITIDVAYRFFATAKRKFIVADTPGHEQYTRNMATGASTADLAIILVDARKGILTQTRRHGYLAKLLGIRRLVLAINKMDLVGYSASRFEEIVADFRCFAGAAGIDEFTAVPVSGLRGENVTARSGEMPWYEGPALLEHLENVDLAQGPDQASFSMAVQWVNRPHSGFRGYAGRIASGAVRIGDKVTVFPSGRNSRVTNIVAFGGDLKLAVAGQSVTLVFADEIDCSRGSIIAAPTSSLELAQRFAADLVWMSDQPLVPGRSYWLKMGAQTVAAEITRTEHVLDIDTLEECSGRSLALNDIGRCEIGLDRPMPAIAYSENRELGGFILIDKLSNATIAAGMVRELSEPRSHGRTSEEAAGRISWITGPSRAERDAVAAKAQQALRAGGQSSFVLDERALREGLSSDLSSGAADRLEQVRRAREVAKLMSRAGVHVLVALDVPAEQAQPGRRISAADLEDRGAGEWII